MLYDLQANLYCSLEIPVTVQRPICSPNSIFCKVNKKNLRPSSLFSYLNCKKTQVFSLVYSQIVNLVYFFFIFFSIGDHFSFLFFFQDESFNVSNLKFQRNQLQPDDRFQHEYVQKTKKNNEWETRQQSLQHHSRFQLFLRGLSAVLSQLYSDLTQAAMTRSVPVSTLLAGRAPRDVK